MKFDINKPPTQEEIDSVLAQKRKSFHILRWVGIAVCFVLFIVLSVLYAQGRVGYMSFLVIDSRLIYLLGASIAGACCLNIFKIKFSHPTLAPIGDRGYVQVMKSAKKCEAVRAYLKEVSIQGRTVCFYEKVNLIDFERSESEKKANQAKEAEELEKQQKEARQRDLAIQEFKNLSEEV